MTATERTGMMMGSRSCRCRPRDHQHLELMMPDRTPAIERLMQRIAEEDRGFITPCWVWHGATNRGGYGNISIAGKSVKSHRAAYSLLVGPIPEGLQLDHLCRVRNCCNPEHLEPVTPRENTRRGNTGMNMSVKTHCPKGHEYSPENTRHTQGRRQCRACQSAWQAIRNARRPKKVNP